ncbi:hypothetical protein V8E54_005037 [Elaphomyces granulatus]
MAANCNLITLANADGIFNITVDRDLIVACSLFHITSTSPSEFQTSISLLRRKSLSGARWHIIEVTLGQTLATNRRYLSKWDQRYMQVNPEMLRQITLAADFLQIKALLDLCHEEREKRIHLESNHFNSWSSRNYFAKRVNGTE